MKLDTESAHEAQERKQAEEAFHDRWSREISATDINVDKVVGSCTAPELRYIFSEIGSVKEKRVLDLGCGFGEASVQFARLGALVTAFDISSGMLEQARSLASRYGVGIETMQGDVESLDLPDHSFDIIYAGNVLHHARIDSVMKSVRRVLKPDGIFVSWDPLAYNPLINIYRRLAAEVRTPGERPISRADVALIKSNFVDTKIRFFWLTALLVFLHMFILQARSPRKERFWKKVLDEADSWRGIYEPLEQADRFLLRAIPGLGWFCWNIVVICRAVRP